MLNRHERRRRGIQKPATAEQKPAILDQPSPERDIMSGAAPRIIQATRDSVDATGFHPLVRKPAPMRDPQKWAQKKRGRGVTIEDYERVLAAMERKKRRANGRRAHHMESA